MTTTHIDDGNRSLQRGLDVLDCVRQHARGGVRVMEIMRLCMLERATVYRLLSTLIAAGYVAKRDRYWYVPGPRIQDVSGGAPVNELATRLQPVLRHISEITEDSAFAVVRDGAQSHCIARQIGTFPVQVLIVQVGRRQPLGVGAAGLALLASLPEHEAAAMIAANAATLGSYGGMTPERMQLLLKATRERGWSVVGNHVATDTLGVGIAIPATGGVPLAAISVAAPLARMQRQRQTYIIKTIQDALGKLLPTGL
ncbi:IclR family transcriptional regulator [Cupriavidus sp. 2TAF22]|uniref:IclR family transcriptional regulator n=1 Tax=unclassified Cupriavidus TaxID=2640874 RepID=UPI003F938D53